jgi:hypothetical protein
VVAPIFFHDFDLYNCLRHRRVAPLDRPLQENGDRKDRKTIIERVRDSETLASNHASISCGARHSAAYCECMSSPIKKLRFRDLQGSSPL